MLGANGMTDTDCAGPVNKDIRSTEYDHHQRMSNGSVVIPLIVELLHLFTFAFGEIMKRLLSKDRRATRWPLPRVLLVLLLSGHSSALLYKDGSCPILTLLPFSGKPGPYKTNEQWTPRLAGEQSFSYMAAAQLAMDHFNARDSRVVPELADLTKGCTVHFPELVSADSGFNPSTSIQQIWESAPIFQQMSNGTSSFPCGIVGPIDGKTCLHLASVTEAFDIPQVMFYSENDIIVSGHQRSAVGVAMAQYRRARLIASYLQQPGQEREHLAATYTSKPESLWLGKDLPEIGREREIGLNVQMFLQGEGGRNDIYKEMRQSGIRTILLTDVFASNLKEIAESLEEENMLTDQFLYILSHVAVQPNLVGEVYKDIPVGSVLDKLLSGSLVFDRVDGFDLDDSNDPFLEAWEEQDQATVDRLNAMFPLPTDDPAFFQAPPDYFQVTRPAKYASSAYDSVIALGLGSCKMQEQGFAMGKEKNRGGERFPPPLPHAASILRSSFQGASGHVSFGGDVPQARSIKGLSFGVYNIRPIMSNSGKDMHSYEAVLTSIWSEEAQRWRQIQNVVYRDGSSLAPSVLLEVLETNYLDNSVRIIGLVLFATVWLVAFGGMALVWCLRKDDLVRRGQPEFLQSLCFGSAVMGTAIFTLSWDEGAGWSDQQLDVACMLTPWFFFLGQTLGFAALFTKLWRIERVMQFTRRMVSVRHVIGPLILLMCIALLILGLWTGLDPWVWEREVIQVSPSESYGQCSSENLWAYFGPLMGVIMISEAATVFLAWKTSDIQQDLSDCHGILLAIAFQLQAWLVGVPVLAVLGNSSADATYLGRVFLIWIFSISSVLIVVWPKIYNAINLRRHPELAQTSRVRVSVYGPKSNGKRSSEMSKFNENQFCSKDAMVLSAGALDVSHGSGSGTTQKNNSFSACLPEQAKCPAGEGLEFAVES